MIRFFKYTGLSFFALVIDSIVYYILLDSMRPSIAAVIGYIVGLGFAYFWMSRFLFTAGWLNHRKSLEFIMFSMSGVVGLVITFLTIYLFVDLFNLSPLIGKVLAVVFSFFSVYLMRVNFVFKTDRFTSV